LGILGNCGSVGLGNEGIVGKLGSCSRLRAARLVVMLEKDNNATIAKRIEELL